MMRHAAAAWARRAQARSLQRVAQLPLLQVQQHQLHQLHRQQQHKTLARRTFSGAAPPQDEFLTKILRDVKTIAMVGASGNWKRPSFFAMKYLQKKGFRVIPINPGAAKKSESILGEPCFASLAEVPGPIDMVDIFRNSEAALGICEEAVALQEEKGIQVVWMQLGVTNKTGREMCEAHGIRVVENRCPKIEYSRLFKELGWHGFNSGVISSKRNRAGQATEASGRIQGEVGFETKCIHAGSQPDAETGARVTPIFQNTAFVFRDVDDAASLFNLQSLGNIYGRLSNPTTAALEERIATLEGGRGATCASSGHAAQLLTLFTLLQPGDHFVASTKLYGGSITQFKKVADKFDWHVNFVDTEDVEAVRAELAKPRRKFLWVESLANPGGVVSDLEPLAAAAREAGVPFIVDNTLATPFLCNPGAHGADIVVHSTTKFLAGHGNAMGGCIVDMGSFEWDKSPQRFPALVEPEAGYHGLVFYESFGDLAFTMYCHAVGLRDLGPTMAPMNAFLTLMGVETLPLRMQRHCESAQAVAEFLEGHPKVAWVSFAGLESSQYRERASRYMPRGAGSVFTFGLKGGFEDGITFVESCNLFSHLANIGDTRSLILHPGSTTHRQLDEQSRAAAGAGDDVIRLSVGLETPADLIADLESAFAQLN